VRENKESYFGVNREGQGGGVGSKKKRLLSFTGETSKLGKGKNEGNSLEKRGG